MASNALPQPVHYSDASGAGTDVPATPDHRRRVLIELLVLIVLFEWVLWTDSRQVFPKSIRTANSVILVVAMLGLLARQFAGQGQRPTLEAFGLKPRSWSAGLPGLTSFTAGASCLLLVAGWYFGTVGQVDNLPRWAWKNWHLEGAQQIVLQVILVPRLAILLGRTGWRVSLAGSVIFAFMHAPNWLLVGLTSLAGFVWCEWFRRYRNLPALWLSHFLLALAVLYSLNGPFLGMLRVGIGYVYR